MKRLTNFLIAVAFLMSMGNAQATGIIADARGDFVPGAILDDPGILPATGTGTWNYLASDTVNPTLDVTLDVLKWSVVNSGYYFLVRNAVDLQSGGLAADEIRMHPSPSSAPPAYTVARWIAGVGEAGVIDISGNVRKVDVGGGDGVTFDIFVDGVSIFASTLAFNDNVGVAFSQNVTVGVGSTVDFVVGVNLSDANDSTGLRATITQVPEPGTAGLLALGLAGMGLTRRRMVH